MTKKDLNGAKSAIDIALKDAETQKDQKAWYYKGFIYKEIYKTNEKDKFESTTRIESIQALKKCISIDQNTDYAKQSVAVLKFLATTLKNDGANLLNQQKHKDAIKAYEQYLDVYKFYETKIVDTSTYFYIGYSAYETKDYDKALSNFQQAASLKYNNSNLYFLMSKIYQDKKDNNNALKVLEEGQKLFPNDRDLVIAQVNIYKELNKIDELENKLNKAVSMEPKNTDLLMMLALVYEKKMEQNIKNKNKYNDMKNKALDNYNKILKLNPNHLDANYNLGILYYNEAVTKIQESEYETDLIALSQLQDDCIEIFKKSLPYMEKAYSLDPNNKNTLLGLSGIYFSLNDEAKSNEFKAKYDALNK
ncbi:MAG: tetratricopeptide repeat protein [Cytophagales bacterium]